MCGCGHLLLFTGCFLLSQADMPLSSLGVAQSALAAIRLASNQTLHGEEMGIVNITARRSRRESRRSLNSSHVLAVAIATIATDYFTMVFYLCKRYLQACEHER